MNVPKGRSIPCIEKILKIASSGALPELGVLLLGTFQRVGVFLA
jgi:hypothetical protein